MLHRITSRVLAVALIGCLAACHPPPPMPHDRLSASDLAERGSAYLDTLTDSDLKVAHDNITGPKVMTQREKARVKLDNAANVTGKIAGGLLVLALLTLVASFILPIVPRAASFACLAGAGAGYAAQYFLLVYGVAFAEIAVWASFACVALAAVTVGWPLAVAWRNRTLVKTSNTLALKGHYDAAVAMRATAMPRLLPDSAARKAMLATLKGDKA